MHKSWKIIDKISNYIYELHVKMLFVWVIRIALTLKFTATKDIEMSAQPLYINSGLKVYIQI